MFRNRNNLTIAALAMAIEFSLDLAQFLRTAELSASDKTHDIKVEMKTSAVHQL